MSLQQGSSRELFGVNTAGEKMVPHKEQASTASTQVVIRNVSKSPSKYMVRKLDGGFGR